jgi:hypothetical protein
MYDEAARQAQPGDAAPPLADLLTRDLLVPIRSSSGAEPDAASVPTEAFRRGTDDRGERFIAAFTDPKVFAEYGPPQSDHVLIGAQDLVVRADAVQERLVVDPGAATQVELSVAALPFLAAGFEPSHPDVQRARSPLGALPTLEAPTQVPEPFGSELRRVLEELPQVERAWLLRADRGWSAGIKLRDDAVLSEFDEVRNRLHALATERLGSRRLLAVTDLRAPSLRSEYEATAPPFYAAGQSGKGLLSRIFGG